MRPLPYGETADWGDARMNRNLSSLMLPIPVVRRLILLTIAVWRRRQRIDAEIADWVAERGALVDVQREEFREDNDAYYDGLFQFYSDRSQGTDIPRNNQLPATGSSEKLHPYVVTLTPEYKTTDAIVVKVNTFEDTRKPFPNMYIPPRTEIAYREGLDKLSIAVGKADPAALAAGHPVDLTNKRVVPAGGYLIVATDLAGTGINLPTNQ